MVDFASEQKAAEPTPVRHSIAAAQPVQLTVRQLISQLVALDSSEIVVGISISGSTPFPVTEARMSEDDDTVVIAND